MDNERTLPKFCDASAVKEWVKYWQRELGLFPAYGSILDLMGGIAAEADHRKGDKNLDSLMDTLIFALDEYASSPGNTSKKNAVFTVLKNIPVDGRQMGFKIGGILFKGGASKEEGGLSNMTGAFFRKSSAAENSGMGNKRLTPFFMDKMGVKAWAMVWDDRVRNQSLVNDEQDLALSLIRVMSVESAQNAASYSQSQKREMDNLIEALDQYMTTPNNNNLYKVSEVLTKTQGNDHTGYDFSLAGFTFQKKIEKMTKKTVDGIMGRIFNDGNDEPGPL